MLTAVVSGLSLVALVAGVLVHNAQLQAAVQQATDSAAEAHRQQQRADAEYRAARDTLDRMRQRLERWRPGEVPQLKELQRGLLEDQLTFYEGALGGADDPDPAVRRDTAWAHQRAAAIQLLLSRWPDAEQNLTRAIDLVEALPAAEREAPETQDLLARCYSDRGFLAGHPADRERDFGKALEIRERLAQEMPDEPGRQDSLATTEHQLGQVLMSASRWADAERRVARAAAIRTRLVQDHPQEESYQEALAEDYVNLELVYGATHREAEAVAVHEKLETLLRPLIARHPEDVRQPLALAAADINWGLHLGGKGQRQAAIVRCTEAVELAEAALRREPSHYMARGIARNAHGARAQNHEALGRWAEAVKDWDRVIELDDGPQRWPHRVLRAMALAAAGQHVRAAAEAAALEGDPAVSADGLHDLAVAYAASIQAARSDAGLSSAERERLAEQYASRAVAVLQKLQARGYFKDAGHAKALRTDEDLQPLRGREDFRRLLAAVGNK